MVPQLGENTSWEMVKSISGGDGCLEKRVGGGGSWVMGLQAEESYESIARLRPGERVYTAQQGAGEASRYKRGSSTRQGAFHGALQH